MYRLFLAVTLGSSACIGASPPTTTSDDPTGACALAADNSVCPDCSDGELTCSFGAVEVTVASCGECQSRATLYEALCDAGETADRATIEADTVCAAPTCTAWFDTCGDACTWQCTRDDQVPTYTPCDIGCPDTGTPDPGVCAWNGTACAFE